MLIELEDNELKGYGEACLPAYLGEETLDTISFLAKAEGVLSLASTSSNIDEIMRELDQLSSRHNAAKAGINIALWDMKSKCEGRGLSESLGLSPYEPVSTSATIGIDDDELILQKKITETEQFPILKIKAGTNDDKKLIGLVRKYTSKPLYVDVNQGWTNEVHALEMLHWMKEKNVLMVEQPMPVEEIAKMRYLRLQSPLPLIADESVKRLKDLGAIADCFHGINIKLMKSCGISEARQMIQMGKKMEFKIMLGCMAESSCATSAMLHLSSLGDYLDLDAPNLIVNDPFEGVSYYEGKVQLRHKTGNGAILRDVNFFN